LVNSERLGFISRQIMLKKSQKEERCAFDRTSARGHNDLKINAFFVAIKWNLMAEFFPLLGRAKVR